MQPTYVTKALTVATSSGIGSVTGGASPVVTINSSVLAAGTQRRVILWTSAAIDTSGTIFTISGLRDDGTPVVESVLGTTNGTITRTTINDFASVTSITLSGSVTGPSTIVRIGTSSLGGTPWKLVDHWGATVALSAGITLSATTGNVGATIDYTNDDITNTYPNLNVQTTAALPLPVFPAVFQSSALTAVTSPTIGMVGQLGLPFQAWRMTITSSSSSAGTAFATVIQSGD